MPRGLPQRAGTVTCFLWAVITIGVIAAGSVVPIEGSSELVVRSQNITVELSEDGKIVGLVIRGKRRAVLGETHLDGCKVQGLVESAKDTGGGVRFKKKLVCQTRWYPRECSLVEEFLPAEQSMRWQIQIEGQGLPWSTAIETRLQYPNANDARFWTAWADPQPGGWHETGDWKSMLHTFEASAAGSSLWRDPLVAASFSDRKLWYGAPYYQYDHPRAPHPPLFPNVFSIPLATVIDLKSDLGLSLALSPEDVLLELTLDVSAKGEVIFSRLFRRISEESMVHFSMDLIAHESDWRGGVRWMSTRYPDYFDSPLASAQQLGGTAAYSAYDGELDVEKLKRMAFRVNWRASVDFPYQGMFLPPIPDDQQWERQGLGRISIPQLAAYSRRMREMGFEILNYFNVSEFGTNMVYPPPQVRSGSDSDLWRDPNAFLYSKLSDAMLYRPIAEKQDAINRVTRQGDPYVSFDSFVLDCGEPSYQNFLLEQARRLIEKIPDSAGICIDRLDWMRLYNFRRDDGVSWYDGPVRSMISSWKGLLDKLGPLEHDAGQVIFVNDHVRRIDLLRHVDGLFDEHAFYASSINATAFLGLFKPVLGWVVAETNLKPDPDNFLQRYLYLGIFPMAPFPGNDHSILPSKWADKQYLDYGPLFEAIRSKRWVLLPRVISVAGDAAKANLFQVQGGYSFPVVFGGSASNATVTLRGIPEVVAGKKIHCELIHPGESKWQNCEFTRSENTIIQKVPLRRGCAMVRIRFE